MNGSSKIDITDIPNLVNESLVITADDYKSRDQGSGSSAQDKPGEEMEKLICYVVPFSAIYFLLVKKYEGSAVRWHARQSIVFQLFLYVVTIVLRFLGIPIISYLVVNLILLAGAVLLIYCGVVAYNNDRYRIPVLKELLKEYL